MIVMNVKFLKQSNKSICTNLSNLMGIRGSSDKRLIIAEFSQHPSHHQGKKKLSLHKWKLHTLNLHVALLELWSRSTLSDAEIRFILALAISLL